MKKNIFILSIILGIICYTAIASAFSMSPGSYLYEYDELKGIQQEFDITLRSSTSQKISLSIAIGDDLAEYIQIDPTPIILEPNQAKTVRGKITVPPGLDKVGRHEAKIIFTKSLADSQGGGFMVVTTALAARIFVVFAYPGEYITISKLEPINVNEGQNTIVHWEVKARGIDLTSFVSELSIYDRDNTTMFSTTSPRRYLERNEVYGETVNIPSSSFKPGSYNVLLKSSSANNSVEDLKTLRIGEEDVSLIKFIPQNFTVGEIVEFSFIVENMWNGEFSNVYGVLDVAGISTTTKSSKVGAFKQSTFDKQFIDLRRLEEGTHNGTLTIFFDGKTKSFDVSMTAVSQTKETNNTLLIFGGVVFVLIIIAGLILLFKREGVVIEKSKASKK